MIRVGSTVGNYTVVSQLGQGAMATVFLAEHPRIGKRVAIKVIHPELSTSQEMVSRFFTEARAASQIHHENVVDIQDFGQTPDGDNFIIMEHLEGDTLATKIKGQGRLDPARAVRIATLLTEGLAAAHAKGVVHRDLKPDNIYLVRRGNEADFPKILDFGLAKITGTPAQAEAVHKTRTGSVLGTPHYMAPEQCEGKSTVDARADIYSLGCILFFMLTGELPFPGEGFGEVLVKHLREPAPSPRRLNSQISEALDKVVLHCLAKRREYRFQTVLELGRALRNPDRFSQEIGDDLRRIVGPMPGEADLAPPPQAPPMMEPPPTLVGQSAFLGLPPPQMMAPPPNLPVGPTAAPEQRTMFAMAPNLPPQVQAPPPEMPANMMQTVLTGHTPIAAPPQGPQGAQGARGGHTMVAEYNPGFSSHNMPTMAPGNQFPPFPQGGFTANIPAAPPAEKPASRSPIILGAIGGLVLVVGVILALVLRKPTVYTIPIASIPEGAKVLLNGKEAGKTPYVLQMKKGDPDLRLTVQKDGFLDSVRVLSAKEQTLSLRLTAKPPEDDEIKPEAKPETKPEAKPETKPETKPDVKPETKPDVKPEAKPDKKPDKKPGKITKPDKPQVKPLPIKRKPGGLVVPF